LKINVIPSLSISDKIRFWPKVKKSTNCWLWNASTNIDDYGVFSIRRKTYPAHRISYFLRYPDFDQSLELDHLCHNRSCVNPDHLDPVTHPENLNRGICSNREKTACPRGHPYDMVDSNGRRWCINCVKITQKNYRKRKSSL